MTDQRGTLPPVGEAARMRRLGEQTHLGRTPLVGCADLLRRGVIERREPDSAEGLPSSKEARRCDTFSS